MKKLALMVCVLMLFSMVACADNGNADNGNDGNIVDDANDAIEEGVGGADEGAVTDKDGSGGANGGNGEEVNNDNENNVNENNNGNLEQQTLKGTANGYGGEVNVTVQVDGEDIVSVEVVGEKETQGVGSNAIEQLPEKIEEADSTDVEVVSGATVTSNAIIEAVNKALEELK